MTEHLMGCGKGWRGGECCKSTSSEFGGACDNCPDRQDCTCAVIKARLAMTEHLPECPKSGCEACYEQGQHDALAAAVQRVEALDWDINTGMDFGISEVIAAIKGDAP